MEANHVVYEDEHGIWHPERRTVTHVDNGEVWAPIEKLGALLALASDIDAHARYEHGLGLLGNARTVHSFATRLRILIGADIEPLDQGETRSDKERVEHFRNPLTGSDRLEDPPEL